MDTKKLRQKILDLAIRGKLIPQDPNDEPASVLLERISAEKERLIKEGKIKRSNKPATDKEIEAPFEIPEGWEWCIVADFAYVAAGSTPNKDAFVEKGVPYIKMYNLRNQKIDFDYHPQYIKSEVHNGKLKRSRTEVGDLIMNIVGPPLGKMAIIPESLPESNFNQAAVLIRPLLHKKILVNYLFYYLSQMSEINSISTKGSAGQVNISLTQSQNMRIALPPLQEQLRIVAAIEQRFSLIDALENNEGDLLKAIDKAKSKILNLAIHGKLVPQAPNDEAAIDLLKRINPKFEPCENEHDTTELPNSWCWARLESLSTDSADGPFGSNLKKEHYTINKEVRIIQLSNIGDEGWREENTKYTTFEHLKDISRSEVMPNDIVIAKMMPAGRAILCPNNEKKYVLSSDAVKFHLKDEINSKYILYAINSETFRKQVYENVQGVTRVRTSLQKLRKYCLPIPPYKEQLRIVAKIEELFTVLDSIKESLT